MLLSAAVAELPQANNELHALRRSALVRDEAFPVMPIAPKGAPTNVLHD